MTGAGAEHPPAENKRPGSAGRRWAERQTVRASKKTGKVLTMRQLRKMSSVLAKRMYQDAKREPRAADRKQCAVAYGVLVDKLRVLEPRGERAQVEHDGDPEQLAAIQDLALRIAEAGRAREENGA